MVRVHDFPRGEVSVKVGVMEVGLMLLTLILTVASFRVTQIQRSIQQQQPAAAMSVIRSFSSLPLLSLSRDRLSRFVDPLFDGTL